MDKWITQVLRSWKQICGSLRISSPACGIKAYIESVLYARLGTAVLKICIQQIQNGRGRNIKGQTGKKWS